MSDIADDLRAAFSEKGTLTNDEEGQPLVQEATERDESGVVAPKTPAKDTAAPEGENEGNTPEGQDEGQEGAQEGQSAQPAGQQPAGQPLRAPISWKPEVREEWSKLSPTVQAEIARREREVDITLSRTADARKFNEQFAEVVRPYAEILRRENAHPLAAVQELFRSAAALRSNDSAAKADLVADMITRFNVDVEALDETLSKKVGGQGGFDPSVIDQKLAPIMHMLTNMNRPRQEDSSQEILQEWQQFSSAPENEFANDVRGEMGDLLQMASQRGQTLSLQEAYRRATLAHPTIARIIEQRKQTNDTAQQTAAARRAREAAASIPSSGAPSRGQENEQESDSIRAAISASMKSLSTRR